METGTSPAATALLTEHLQYTPLSLIDDIFDSVNNYIYQGVGSLETGLLSTPPERLGFKATDTTESEEDSRFPHAKQEIEEGLHKLETLLNSTVDKNFDKFELYVLRNILSVPEGLTQWIRLSHYDGLTHPPPANAPSPEQIQLLRRKLLASREVSRNLISEFNRNEVILGQLRDVVSGKPDESSSPRLNFLGTTVSQQPFSAHHPLTTNTKFSLSQLPALKATLAELRARLATLDQAQMTTESAKDEMREERRRYIEQRTRQHLEKSGQAASESGPLPGKQTNPAEVAALEKAAGMFNPP